MSAALNIQHSGLALASRRAEPKAEPSFMTALIASAEKYSSDTAPEAGVKPVQAPPQLSAQPAGAGLLLRVWSWLKKNQRFSPTRQLRVSETVSLGEKRFVAVVHVDGQKFLIGGGASGVSLLTQLSAPRDSADASQDALSGGVRE